MIIFYCDWCGHYYCEWYIRLSMWFWLKNFVIIMTVSADEGTEPLYFPLRSRRASFPFSLAAASSRTSLSSEGSKSMIVSYRCKQTTTGFFTKKTKDSYEGKFLR